MRKSHTQWNLFNWIPSKPKTCLNQMDFTVPSTKCLCNLNLCKPSTCLNWTNSSVPNGLGLDRFYCVNLDILVNNCSIRCRNTLTHYQLFNGDFVDRGSFSVECIFTLFSFKLLYPDNFFMARGKIYVIFHRYLYQW